jgi:hypothetical protein
MPNEITITGNGRVIRRQSKKAKPKTSSTVQRFTFTAETLSEPTAIATFVRASSDGRRQHRQIEEVAAPPPLASSPALDQIDLDAGDHQVYDDLPLPFIDLLEKEVADEAATKPRARRYVSSVSILSIRNAVIILITLLLIFEGRAIETMD